MGIIPSKDDIRQKMIEDWKRRYFRESNHVYCKKNGHHKRCFLANEKWLCPICDAEELEKFRKEHGE